MPKKCHHSYWNNNSGTYTSRLHVGYPSGKDALKIGTSDGVMHVARSVFHTIIVIYGWSQQKTNKYLKREMNWKIVRYIREAPKPNTGLMTLILSSISPHILSTFSTIWL